MKKPTEHDFIQSFAKDWNERLTDHTYSLQVNEQDAKLYLGWMNLEQMLKEFVKAYRKREKREPR